MDSVLHKLFDRYTGYALLFVQTGDMKHLKIADQAKLDIFKRTNGVEVLKEKNGNPTVIEINGITYLMRHPDQMKSPPCSRAKRR